MAPPDFLTLGWYNQLPLTCPHAFPDVMNCVLKLWAKTNLYFLQLPLLAILS